MSSSGPILLGVNIDHSATLRQARYRSAPRTCGGIVEPDPVAVALAAEKAGADAITLHLREDRRHVQPRDVERMRECIATQMNFEMACTPAMVRFALGIKPETVLLVPENRTEVTTEGGLDVVRFSRRVAGAMQRLQDAGIAVSLFIDPDGEQIDEAARLGAEYVELHTGAFANAHSNRRRAIREFERLFAAAEQASGLGLGVNAGHGINYVNIAEVRRLPHLRELNIGHAIMCRALFTGIAEAVREMKARMAGGDR